MAQRPHPDPDSTRTPEETPGAGSSGGGAPLGSEVADRHQLTAQDQLLVEEERTERDLAVEGAVSAPREHRVRGRSSAQDGQAS